MQDYLKLVMDKIKTEIEKIVGAPIRIGISNELNNGLVCMNINNSSNFTRICTFSLIPMPGCCGMIIASAVAVFAPHNGKGIGKLLLQAREQASLDAGYTLLLETCTEQANGREIGLLEKYGYKRIDRFINNRTKNTVVVLTRNLREPVKVLENKA